MDGFSDCSNSSRQLFSCAATVSIRVVCSTVCDSIRAAKLSPRRDSGICVTECAACSLRRSANLFSTFGACEFAATAKNARTVLLVSRHGHGQNAIQPEERTVPCRTIYQRTGRQFAGMGEGTKARTGILFRLFTPEALRMGGKRFHPFRVHS